MHFGSDLMFSLGHINMQHHPIEFLNVGLGATFHIIQSLQNLHETLLVRPFNLVHPLSQQKPVFIDGLFNQL